MADSISPCPKCQGGMVRGFLPEVIVGETRVSTWNAGPPKWTFWRGARGTDERSIPIGAFRCSACGYLDLYARSEFRAVGGPVP